LKALHQQVNFTQFKKASKQEHGLHCGFCTPGMMLAAKALLDKNDNPTEDEVRWALSGNLCRCTGYQNIVKSVLWAAEKMRAESK
jgi:aerobic carbon-monoxide dehydrogenase small subunit